MGKQLISDRTLTAMRNVQQELMPDTCLIETPAALLPIDVVADGSNIGDGLDQGLTPTTISSVCRVSARPNVTETEVAGRVEGETLYYVSLPWDTVIVETDTIIFGGVRLEILDLLQPKSYLTAVRCVCRKLT